MSYFPVLIHINTLLYNIHLFHLSFSELIFQLGDPSLQVSRRSQATRGRYQQQRSCDTAQNKGHYRLLKPLSFYILRSNFISLTVK